MNAAIQGRSRYLDGLPAIELWGVSKGPKKKGEVNSRSEAHRLRRKLKRDARLNRSPLRRYIREFLEILKAEQ